MTIEGLSFQYLLARGDVENTTVIIINSSNKPAPGVNIFGMIEYSDGSQQQILGKTNNDGIFSQLWAVRTSRASNRSDRSIQGRRDFG